jgi:hypothetical protein
MDLEICAHEGSIKTGSHGNRIAEHNYDKPSNGQCHMIVCPFRMVNLGVESTSETSGNAITLGVRDSADSHIAYGQLHTFYNSVSGKYKTRLRCLVEGYEGTNVFNDNLLMDKWYFLIVLLEWNTPTSWGVEAYVSETPDLHGKLANYATKTGTSSDTMSKVCVSTTGYNGNFSIIHAMTPTFFDDMSVTDTYKTSHPIFGSKGTFVFLDYNLSPTYAQFFDYKVDVDLSHDLFSSLDTLEGDTVDIISDVEDVQDDVIVIDSNVDVIKEDAEHTDDVMVGIFDPTTEVDDDYALNLNSTIWFDGDPIITKPTEPLGGDTPDVIDDMDSPDTTVLWRYSDLIPSEEEVT